MFPTELRIVAVTETNWFNTLEKVFLCEDISWYNLKPKQTKKHTGQGSNNKPNITQHIVLSPCTIIASYGQEDCVTRPKSEASAMRTVSRD